MSQKKLFIIVGMWLLVSLTASMFRNGLNRDAVTILLVLAYFLASLAWFYKKVRRIKVINSKRTFMAWCLINAMVVEVLHMISAPLHSSLLITSGTPWMGALRNTAVDIILTFPAYVLIFLVVWRLVTRFRYSIFSYFFLIALGQALGDGGAFFLRHPGALIFLPYTMLNYWAMSFVPYLSVRNSIPGTGSADRRFKEIVIPIIVLPLTYLVAGGLILAIGAALGWIPG